LWSDHVTHRIAYKEQGTTWPFMPSHACRCLEKHLQCAWISLCGLVNSSRRKSGGCFFGINIWISSPFHINWHVLMLTASVVYWSSWLQIQRPGFDSRRCHIFWEVVGLEQAPLSLVSTTEKLLGRNSSGSGLESWEYSRRDPSRWPCDTLYPQKLALTSRPIGSCSVSIFRSRTQATEFSLVLVWYCTLWSCQCSVQCL
jgi:hypothetical protein